MNEKGRSQESFLLQRWNQLHLGNKLLYYDEWLEKQEFPNKEYVQGGQLQLILTTALVVIYFHVYLQKQPLQTPPLSPVFPPRTPLL